MRPCRICGGELARLLTYADVPQAAQHLPGEAEVAHEAGIELVVCQCTACGVVQLDNEPVHYWRDVIRAVGFSESMRSFRADQFDAFVRRHGLRGAAALEAGCGDGAYLQLLAGAGLDVLGLEHDAANVRRCREQGLSAEQGYIEEIGRLPKAPFAAFFVFSGNVARIAPLADALKAWLGGGAFVPAALLSQLISNVPAAVVLSRFTGDWAGLLAGVNVGGAGTPIASLATLIVVSHFQSMAPGLRLSRRRFWGRLLGLNFACLAVLLAVGLAAAW